MMRVGLSLGHSRPLGELPALLRRAERAGVDSVWVSEAYGTDAVSVLGYLAAFTDTMRLGTAVLQMPARTPANTAMTALTLDQLSGGRLVLGLGSSGPQVVEGWHGVPFAAPLARTREYVSIVHAAVAREAPLRHEGRHYRIPYRRPDGSAQRSIKASVHPVRPRIPIYLASNGPKAVSLAAEIADGWLPAFYSPEKPEVYAAALAEGTAARDPALGPLDLVATVHIAAGDDLAACRDAVRPAFALYLGGMGSRETNFYTALAGRIGYEAEARAVQNLYLDGHRAEAIAAVPDALIDELALVGPLDRVVDRLRVWQGAVDAVTLKTTDIPLAERLLAAL
ncbi:LLM class F420-dependent oxidoreductase [Dactylosporangium sp. NPDC000555]|uniref:LLM class F420-dependent oxidoreductase n=1 Tax=Dactylosporangium sp. NPDC000555 TaxID=3154260 RepID=UPI00331EECCF